MGQHQRGPHHSSSSVLITFSDFYSNETLLVIEVHSEPVFNVNDRLGIPQSDVERIRGQVAVPLGWDAPLEGHGLRVALEVSFRYI